MLRQTARTAAAIGIVSAIIAICFEVHHVRNTTICFCLLLAILWVAVKWGRAPSIIASIAAAFGFATFFQPPIGSPKIDDPQGWVAVFGFLVTSITVSQLSLQALMQREEALERKRETERLYALGQCLLGCDRFETVAWMAINQMSPLFGAGSAAFYYHGSGELHRAGESDGISAEQLRECAISQSLQTDSIARTAIIPLQLGDEPFGSIGLTGVTLSETVLKSIQHLLIIALERGRSAEQLAQQHQEVVRQRQVSESLLLNILPPEVAEELRTKGMVAPKYFEDVTIMFTDFVGFTVSTEHLAAEDLVEQLNDYFTAFDRICRRYGIEKLKTIGDSYMCISGLPNRNPAHPVDTVLSAFEMVHEVTERQHTSSGVHWDLRVGIHTGPVIAGVVGINKFAFDIWGDTVNFSSRMESTSQPNRINLSERTYSRVKDFFECEYRGKVMTKEKRDFDMYFVKGVLPRLMEGERTIAPAAFTRRYNVYFQKSPPAFPDFLAGNVNEVPQLSGLAQAISTP